MNHEILAPFVGSLGDTFSTMLNCEIRPHSGNSIFATPHYHDVSGIIGFTGRGEGIVVVSLSRLAALQAASALLLVETTEINADVIDAIGEIANMVAGAAKAKLESYRLRIGLPSVITGPSHEISMPSNVQPMCIGFDSDWGPLSLTVGMMLVEAATPIG